MIHKLGFCWCGTAHVALDDIPEPYIHCMNCGHGNYIHSSACEHPRCRCNTFDPCNCQQRN